MLNLLRKLRRSLWGTGGIRKYCLYAIGEIALVVIGILIALQINNWNQQRINKIQESIYIQAIERDLNEQIVHIDAQISWEIDMAQIAQTMLIDYDTQSKFEVDSVFSSRMGTLSLRRTFTMIDATYEELVSTGNINILSNSTFKESLIKYYEKLERVVAIIHKNNSYFTDQEFLPKILNLIPIIRPESLNQTSGLSNIYEVQGREYLPSVKENLLSLAQKRVNHPDNVTTIFNCLSLKYDLSLIANGFMVDLKTSTEELIASIPDQYPD